jgi:hypothetical protein
LGRKKNSAITSQPRNPVTEAAMIEQAVSARMDAEWPATEAAIEKANSEESVKQWEDLLDFLVAKRKYEAALKTKNLDDLIAATANKDLRRKILSKKFRGRGSPSGARHPEQLWRVNHARHLLGLFREIWPGLQIIGLPPKFEPQLARKIVESFLAKRLNWSLRDRWWREH